MSDWSSPDPQTGGTPPPPDMPPPPPSSAPPPPPPPAPSSGGWSGGRRIPLRPMRFGEILDASFKLFRLTFVQVTVLVVITLGLFTILQVFVQPPQPGLMSDPAQFDDPFSATDGVRFLLSGIIAIITQLFVLPLVRGAATGIAVEADRGGDTSWEAGLRTARELAGRLIGLSFLLLGLGILVMLALAIVAGLPIFLFVQADVIPLVVVWGLLSLLLVLVVVLVGISLVYLAVPILLVERLRPVAAVRRSIELVRPQLLRVVGLVFVATLLVSMIGAVLAVLTVPLALLGGRIAQFGTAVISVLAYVITVPFEANVALLLYVDARVRAEGLDVAVLTAELDQL